MAANASAATRWAWGSPVLSRRGQPRNGLLGFQQAKRQRGPGAFHCRRGHQQVQKVSADRAIADHPDGPRDLVARKRVRVVQVVHQDGQQRGIVVQAEGPRRRRTDAGIGVIQPAYQSGAYFQVSYQDYQKEPHTKRRVTRH